jgi:uncharacterized membrane protein YgcG
MRFGAARGDFGDRPRPSKTHGVPPLAFSLLEIILSLAILAGSRPAAAVSQTVYDPAADPAWLYSIAIENTSYAELLSVRVMVEEQLDAQLQPAKFELVRWVMNPEFVAQAEAAAESAESESASSSSSSSGSSSSGSSSSGGSGSSSTGGGGP